MRECASTCAAPSFADGGLAIKNRALLHIKNEKILQMTGKMHCSTWGWARRARRTARDARAAGLDRTREARGAITRACASLDDDLKICMIVLYASTQILHAQIYLAEDNKHSSRLGCIGRFQSSSWVNWLGSWPGSNEILTSTSSESRWTIISLAKSVSRRAERLHEDLQIDITSETLS